jgi:hypothetical protein
MERAQACRASRQAIARLLTGRGLNPARELQAARVLLNFFLERGARPTPSHGKKRNAKPIKRLKNQNLRQYLTLLFSKPRKFCRKRQYFSLSTATRSRPDSPQLSASQAGESGLTISNREVFKAPKTAPTPPRRKTSPSLFFVFYLICLFLTFILRVSAESRHPSVMAKAFPSIYDLRNFFFCGYVMVLLSIIAYQYDFIHFSRFLLKFFMFLALFGSAGAFFSLCPLFTDTSKLEIFTWIYFNVDSESSELGMKTLTIMAVEFVVFVILASIAGRKREKTPPTAP